MISVIICSRNNEIPAQLKSNIDETINVNYEIIFIDNSDNLFSIFEAYNIGIDKSNYEVLCFIHDDILFKTFGWGLTIMNYFGQVTDLGLLGVAGSSIKTLMPSAWWDCPNEFWHLNILQSYPDGRIQRNKSGFEKRNFVEVATIDGVFMAMRKNPSLRFDNTLCGFHGYDFNISMEWHIINKKVCVTKEILIHHQSKGEINSSWYKNMLILHRKYKDFLPIIKECPKEFDYYSVERKNGFNYLKYALQLNLNKKIFELIYLFFRFRPSILMKKVLFKKLIQGILNNIYKYFSRLKKNIEE